LPNPGKGFLWKLTAQVVKDVNLMRDANGLTYARKAVIRCGMPLDLDGQWCASQLLPELQI